MAGEGGRRAVYECVYKEEGELWRRLRLVDRYG